MNHLLQPENPIGESLINQWGSMEAGGFSDIRCFIKPMN
jgi:hypothetical protein